MKLLDTFILPAALLTSVFAMSIPDAQKMGAENMEVENSENICRPRLSKSHFTTTIIQGAQQTGSDTFLW